MADNSDNMLWVGFHVLHLCLTIIYKYPKSSGITIYSRKVLIKYMEDAYTFPARVFGKGKVTIPQAVRDALGIEDETTVEVTVKRRGGDDK